VFIIEKLNKFDYMTFTKTYLAFFSLFSFTYGIAVAFLFQSSTDESFRSDIGTFFSITGMYFAIWIAVKLSQSSKLRENLEHQHYVERLSNEIQRLVGLVDTISSLHKRMIKNEGNNEKIIPDLKAVELNRVHAEKSLERLRTINSIFNIPSQIRSECDEVLSAYEAFLENVEHRCLSLNSSEQLNAVYAKQAQSFFKKSFFQKNSTDTINENLRKIEELISRIIKKSNVVIDNDSSKQE